MRVCVVGSGPSGLTTVKQLLDENHTVVCYTKDEAIGGIWHSRSKLKGMRVYDDLYLTISAKAMAFSDYMEGIDRVYWTNQEYLEYLHAYCAEFGLKKHIKFNSNVTSAKFRKGKWSIQLQSGVSESFDALCLCTGPFQEDIGVPRELESFQGRVLHSSSYRSPAEFTGKRVLVVGCAESGADVIADVSKVAAATDVVVRSHPKILQRLPTPTSSTEVFVWRAHENEMNVRSRWFSCPYDVFGGSRGSLWIIGLFMILYSLPIIMYQKFVHWLRPPVVSKDSFGQQISANKTYLDAGTPSSARHLKFIQSWNRKVHEGKSTWQTGVILVKNARFVDTFVTGLAVLHECSIMSSAGHTVTLSDGTAKEYDVIILCTGFSSDKSGSATAARGIQPDALIRNNCVFDHFKMCLHPDFRGRFATVGLLRPAAGGVPYCAELQARLFAMTCSNAFTMPDNVYKRIEEEKKFLKRNLFFPEKKSEIVMPQILFLDSIAREIGCLVPVSRLLRDPALFSSTFCSPFNQLCYRIVGPHSIAGAYQNVVDEHSTPVPLLFFLQLIVLIFLPASVHPYYLD